MQSVLIRDYHPCALWKLVRIDRSTNSAVGSPAYWDGVKLQIEGLASYGLGEGQSRFAARNWAVLLKSVPARIASYATQGAGAMVLVNVMRIPCFGRRMTIGRASIVCPGAN